MANSLAPSFISAIAIQSPSRASPLTVSRVGMRAFWIGRSGLETSSTRTPFRSSVM